MLGLLLFVLGAVWSGIGLDETAWAGEGGKLCLRSGGESRLVYSEPVQVPGPVLLASGEGPRKSPEIMQLLLEAGTGEMNEPTAQQGKEAPSPLHINHTAHSRVAQ